MSDRYTAVVSTELEALGLKDARIEMDNSLSGQIPPPEKLGKGSEKADENMANDPVSWTTCVDRQSCFL